MEEEAADGIAALERLKSFKVDMAILLDVMMLNMDGWELCHELRAAYDMPLLMLTARGETPHKVKGFQLGADDYLVKPFEPLELVARVGPCSSAIASPRPRPFKSATCV